MAYKRAGMGDAIKFLERHPLTIKRYLRTFYNRVNWGYIESFFWKNPVQSTIILKDFKKTNDQKVREVFKLFHSAEGTLMYIIGAKGSGKTCTAFFFAEYEHKLYPHRQIFYIGRKFNQEALPSWCGWKEKLQDVPNHAFGIIDELGIQASARDFQKRENKEISQILQLARQKKIPLIVLTQDSRLGEVNVWRLKDILIWKISNTYGFQQRDRGSKEQGFWDKVKYLMKARSKPECLFEYPSKLSFIHFEHLPPKCWSDELSEIYSDAQFMDTYEQKNREVNKDGYIVKKLQRSNRIIIGK